MSLSEPPEDPKTRANLSPALAVRVGIVGSIILGLFAIVFFRLWFLQVLTGTHYVEAAAKNTTEPVAIAPARGEILARNGRTALVSSTTALAAVIVPDLLPVKVNQTNMLRPREYRADEPVFARLARLLKIRNRPHPCTVAAPPPSCNTSTGNCAKSTTISLTPIACDVAQSIALNTYANATIREPVNRDLAYWVAERQSQFRGVQIQQVSVSGYPFKDLAAQTLGTVGRISEAETKQASFKHVNHSAIVGQSGLESEYDRYLRGTYGHQDVEVNASGVAVSNGHRKAPIAGENLRTSLDLTLEQTGDAALGRAVAANGGYGGAYIAMNPQNGSIYAMGSDPSFDPSVFTGNDSLKAVAALEHDAHAPLFNRVVQTAAADGSTFKVITSVAALQSGVWSPEDTYDDPGYWCPPGTTEGNPQCRNNAQGVVGGELNMVGALKISDDVFYYHLGALLNSTKPQGGALQTWARRFGIGRAPNIDLPAHDVSPGLLPTPAWYDEQGRLEAQCETGTGGFRYTKKVDGTTYFSATPKRGYHRSGRRDYAECGYGTAGQTWTIGDNVNTAIGQGGDELSPLQLALVYSAIENGGTIVRPHLGQDIQSPDGTVLQRLSFPAQRHLHIDPEYLDTIRTGLHEAAQSAGGTSDAVMGNFGLPVYGKTGTAQNFENGVETDNAWYAAYVPASATHKPMVVIVYVENGGFGAIGAAPVARQLLSQWYYGKPGAWIEGALSAQ